MNHNNNIAVNQGMDEIENRVVKKKEQIKENMFNSISNQLLTTMDVIIGFLSEKGHKDEFREYVMTLVKDEELDEQYINFFKSMANDTEYINC